jgi:hypothetical protein
MTLMKVRLELGRTDGYPDGDPGQGYEFIVPLDERGQIDAHAWRKVREACTVRQFEAGFTVRKGLVRHVGHGWRFDYDHLATQDDEVFFKLDRHVLQPGRYVSIRDPGGDYRPFRVVSVEPQSLAAVAP